ncbi:MAG TPA: hypothetical protein VE958_03420 [Bryobacteraceae bacterium]|jgi:hypothetical protein|nr:hypothetical protein [Bryobacteraceae bacterium]
MLLSLLAVAGLAAIVLALALDVARSVAKRRQALKRAELIRSRLQDEPSAERVVYREVEIRLGRS